ncbi:MAG TPA: FHA domain-containing serine/threonine-protein kinase, partial [Planctomycetota bacterium]|nr:FHA domain-containing serine/threonine-protein kinase [Planctomycetota bacterium]
MAVRLKVVEGPNAGTIYFLGEGESKVFGRSSSADIQLPDPLLSRHHVMVRGSPAGGLVLDLDSSNGTYLNGRLVKEAPLETGDKLKIGNIVLECELERRGAFAQAALDKVETVRALVFCSRCHRGVLLGERAPLPWEAFVCDECKHRGQPLDERVIVGYRLEEKVGEDATGPLYRAEHVQLGRKALVRFFAPSKGAVDSRALETFLREAGIAGKLSHPNIVETFDAGEKDGLYYIVEEWIAGADLEERLRGPGGPLPVEDVLHIAGKIASALEYAFAQGIVHRNVRPSSIFMGEYGVVKLGDFGLAKTIGGGAASASGITKAGEWKGQANYLPPEQLISETMVDQRSDIYALGASLYHMLSGVPPYDAPTAMRVVRRIGEGDLAPLADVAAKAPKMVRALVERCMERDPARRFQSPREVVA